MRWTSEQVARALGGVVPASLAPSQPLAGVSIDSRTVARGELFFAVRGERLDGHDYVGAAFAAGAAAAVVSGERLAGIDAALHGRLFVVEDTLAALQLLARAVRIAWGQGVATRRLVGVTGSMGKTTTKEILAALLGARVGVLKSQGNLNNQFGVPLTLMRLDESHGAAVIEMGMSARGEIARLAWMARPEVGVVTNVAPVHLEFFSSIDEIALAKRELIEGLAGEAPVAVLNADDPRVARFAEVHRGRVVLFGEGPGAQFRAEKIEELGLEGSAFDFVGPAGRARLRLPLAGRHNVSNALAALAAASLWEITALEAQSVFDGLRPAAMRGEVLRLENGVAVLNDCYNSSPAALAALVDLLARAPGYCRRVLVAGEMLELGPSAPELHHRAGRHAAASGLVDWIVGVRGLAEELVRGAIEAGHPVARARFFASAEEAGAFLSSFAEAGDLVLVKGSRGVRLERVVEAVRLAAQDKTVRRAAQAEEKRG